MYHKFRNILDIYFLAALFFGLLTIALSYIAPLLGDELLQIPTTIWGVAGAPLFGVFILAIFFPFANSLVRDCT